MACIRPLTAYRDDQNGVTWVRAKGGDEIQLACGQCIGCRLERSRQWAIRCMHEAQLHEENSYVTLTYNDENLPANKSLNHRHFQLFAKRLRKKMPRQRLGFFMCGEYGEETYRPHYHAILFGYRPHDMEKYLLQRNKHMIYTSKTLDATWQLGECKIGEVTFESAAYVARYCVPMKTGDARIWDIETGEYRTQEYCQPSRNPAIGLNWLRLYWPEIKDGKTITRGHESSIPRYYRKYLKDVWKKSDAHAEEQLHIYEKKLAGEHSSERLQVKQEILNSRLFKRNIE